ncbi:S-adenosyl-L-methionine-dependent methyltransferase [Aaosphaeria arxii CBS 175.79]|uniref:S-adenosyl-L-methionine-dependent methyltransferase n=1 Tax=Aaosphaeria arxii CBS 175.79 TaxID=1450172 RepID=A0A6A5Y8A4_9PLEO|nr:S-adenosyl-L-methionine-dependent methyltransferase [Aaosphaeria arxii CBS 175.79]KAF2021546.1 S-adenosyl-L-methionine-dependent methyltransferase [Aaosphaeria arxii CBS 175.79]
MAKLPKVPKGTLGKAPLAKTPHRAPPPKAQTQTQTQSRAQAQARAKQWHIARDNKPEIHSPPKSPSSKLKPSSSTQSPPRAFTPPPPRPRQHELELASSQTLHRAKVTRWRQTPLLICGLAAFGIGLYSVQLWISLSRDPPSDIPDDVSDRFDKEAEGYDEKVNIAEILLGLSSKRKALTEQAKGHVLEVAVGTGRNIDYYPRKRCDTVTLLDSSGPMLSVAKRKWRDTHGGEYFGRVVFKQQSALDEIVPPYGSHGGFDTVIQTMGLCSTSRPVDLLRNLERCTREDGGRILLLEHGKSYFGWLNGLLDRTAPQHAVEHGCWWNKDIGAIVEESGLEVVEIKRYNFGTTWWVELRPRTGLKRGMGMNGDVVVDDGDNNNNDAAVAVGKVDLSTNNSRQVAQRSWWALWR